MTLTVLGYKPKIIKFLRSHDVNTQNDIPGYITLKFNLSNQKQIAFYEFEANYTMI